MPAHCWETASCPHSDLFITLKNYQINKYKLVAEAQQPEGCIKSLKNENTKEHNDYSSMCIYLNSFVKYMHALNIANNVLDLLEKCFAWYNIMINHALISQHRIFQKLTRGIRNLKISLIFSLCSILQTLLCLNRIVHDIWNISFSSSSTVYILYMYTVYESPWCTCNHMMLLNIFILVYIPITYFFSHTVINWI